MDLKVLFLILVYYSVLSLGFVLAFSSGSDVFNDYDVNINLNATDISDDETDRGGLFGTGVSFTRFAGLIAFGVGLPDDTPVWFSTIFAFWQTLLTLFSLGFVISSIWNG